MTNMPLRAVPDPDDDSGQQLLGAITKQHWDIKECLAIIKKGANVNYRHGLTKKPLLAFAVHRNSPELLTALLAAGADVNASPVTSKSTPLMQATLRHRTSLLPILVQHGADLEARNRSGLTALALATIHGEPDVIEKLIQLGANVNTKDDKGVTPLAHCAANFYADNGFDGLKHLLNAGADPHARDAVGRTPAEYAKDMGKVTAAVFIQKEVRQRIINNFTSAAAACTTRQRPIKRRIITPKQEPK